MIRQCFRDPIAEIYKAAAYLDIAVCSHLSGDRFRASTGENGVSNYMSEKLMILLKRYFIPLAIIFWTQHSAAQDVCSVNMFSASIVAVEPGMQGALDVKIKMKYLGSKACVVMGYPKVGLLTNDEPFTVDKENVIHRSRIGRKPASHPASRQLYTAEPITTQGHAAPKFVLLKGSSIYFDLTLSYGAFDYIKTSSCAPVDAIAISSFSKDRPPQFSVVDLTSNDFIVLDQVDLETCTGAIISPVFRAR